MRRFYIAIHMGSQAGGATRTLDGHREQLAYLKRREALRRGAAPARWSRADDWGAAEITAIELLLESVARGDVPAPHPLEA
jgi:hypothetical protein